MFASPLVRKVNTNIENVMQLDYKNEISGIEKALKKVNHEIKYKVDVATLNNFRSVITDAPFALHFTGHGVQNNIESLGPSYHFYKDKGNILLLEDENCMAKYLFEVDLKKLVKISRADSEYTHNYEVVFVSSCHSEFTGHIFLSSGARHVVCIKKSETISDKASLRFSRVFYECIFMKKYTVCKAFEIAKEDIKTLYTSSEASKYILLKKESNEGNKKTTSHKCFPVAKFNEGGLVKEEKLPMFSKVLSNDLTFKDRQKEMCEIISLLNTNRLVNILGPPGIGKTSISRKLYSHLADRRIYEDGIIYVKLKGCESTQMFLTRL